MNLNDWYNLYGVHEDNLTLLGGTKDLNLVYTINPLIKEDCLSSLLRDEIVKGVEILKSKGHTYTSTHNVVEILIETIREEGVKTYVKYDKNKEFTGLIVIVPEVCLHHGLVAGVYAMYNNSGSYIEFWSIVRKHLKNWYDVYSTSREATPSKFITRYYKI